MSTELPDFQSAPAWMDCQGQIHTDIDLDPDMEPWLMHQRLAPWTPLDTAEEWVHRTDRDKLAEVLLRVLAKLDDNGSLRSDSTALAAAVLAALPELMKGESDE